MQIILSGVEEIGAYALEKLLHENFNIKLIQPNYLDISTKTGVSSEDMSLLQSNALRTIGPDDYLLALGKDYATNLLACKIAKEKNVKKTVVSIKQSNSETKQQKETQALFGVDVVMNTVWLIADLFTSLLNYPSCIDLYNLDDKKVKVLGFPINRIPKLTNITLKEIKDYFITNNLPIQISFIYSNYTFQQTYDDMKLQESDFIYFVLPIQYCKKLYSFLEIDLEGKKKKQKIVINGGGQVGTALAQILPKNKYDITIIEISESRSVHIAKKLPYATILNFDGLNKDILQSENLENADYFLAVTEKETINITSCLTAFGLGIKKCVPLIRQPSFFDILRSKDYVYTSLAPRIITVRFLLNLLRQSDFINYYPLFNSSLVICEKEIKEDSPSIGKSLEELNLTQEIQTLLLVRQNKYIRAEPNLILQAQDKLIVMGNHIEILSKVSIL